MLKLDTAHLLAALALVATGYMLAKRKTGASTTAHNDVAEASEWWTYAGNWSTP